MSVEPLRVPESAVAAEVAWRLESLLATHGGRLRRMVTQLCPPELAPHLDDIEQEARLRLWRALGRDRGIDHPLSYLYRAARSAAFDAVRRVKARREEPLPAAADGPAWVARPESLEDGAEQRSLLRRIAACLSELPPDRRRAVRLHLEGFTPPEIAHRLGWREPKARSLAYRGLRELRERLAAEVGPAPARRTFRP